MTQQQHFSADVKLLTRLTRKQIRRVIVDSLYDVLEGAQKSAKGITAGGRLKEGRIPVVSGDLINSLAVQVNGQLRGTGQNSYSVGIDGLNVGDYLRFGWTVEYAMRVENGFTGTDATGRTFNQSGWHFVSMNAAKWPAIVERYANKYAVKNAGL